MDFESKKFGGEVANSFWNVELLNRAYTGPRELGGAVDLVNQFKLWPHHELFCKRSLPLSVSETHYLQNVVGDTKIRKGEGMELDQLFHTTTYMRKGKTPIHTFDIGVLHEAFRMKETKSVNLPSAKKRIPALAVKFRNELIKDEEMKHKKHKDKNKNKDKDRKKHKHHNEDINYRKCR